MAGPTIAVTSPTSNAVGVPTNVTIAVTFDQEVDKFRLANGGVFLEGPDESKALGPGLLELDPPSHDHDEFLASPGFKGIKDVTLAYGRVDGSGNTVGYYDYGDTGEAGALYRTQVTLTPLRPLESLTEYTVYIVGDANTGDSYSYGLTGRSVFDPLKGANTGNGTAIFYGGYTGSSRVQYNIRITSAGAAGEAEYVWWTSIDPTEYSGETSLGYRLLSDGVRVKFVPGLQHEIGDTFTVWCDVPEQMDGVYKFSFTTSDQAPEALPTPSTTLGGTGTSTSTSAFTVSSMVPEDRGYLVDPNIASIVITFSAVLNAATITTSTVSAVAYAVDGSTTGDPPYTGALTIGLSVSGAILTITPTAGEILGNNSVVITLDSTIADTSGNTLGSDTKKFFSTELTPYYAGIRDVQFRLGSYASSFAPETIALAIWDGSEEAVAFAPATIEDTAAYERARQKFVVCYAAYILVAGGIGAGGSERVRLSDFDVSRSESKGGGLDDILRDCMDFYREIMMAGGAITDGRPPLQEPVNVVKGDYDVDQPHSGRLWEIPAVPIANTRVLYSGGRRWFKTNWRK